MNIVKRLYDWMLSWGDSRWGAWALFAFAFAESSFFPIPPDVLLIALCLGAVKRSFRFAAICLAGFAGGCRSRLCHRILPVAGSGWQLHLDSRVLLCACLLAGGVRPRGGPL